MRNVNKPCAEINEDQNDKDATVVHTSKVQDGNNSDRESNNSPKTSRKPQKRGRAKLQSVPKTSDMCYPGPLQSQPASSSYGCLSLLKEKSSGDESSALDALHTLSGGSVNILRPSSNAEAESSAHIKEESKDNESAEKPSVPVAVPLFEKKDNSRQRKKIKRLSEIASKGMVTRRSARLMKDLHHDGGAISEVEQKDRRNDESAISEVEAMDNMDTTQNAITQQCDSTSKVRSRHKKGILKALVPEHKDSEGVDDSCDNVTYPMNSVVGLLMFFQDKLLINASHHLQGVEVTTYIYPDLLQDKLSHRLSSRFPRRWCMSEWCCSAIDYPWFMKSEFFSEYLNHVKLGHESAKSEFVEYQNHAKLEHGPKLTRVEWGVIRSSFGKPRRFSKQFLHEEREKLSQHRESVGQRNAELQSGVREGLLTDLARPLAVGQRAIACHLKTRELHDGSVLIVDRNHCRVLQIDGSELRRGFEFVMRTNMQREVTRLRWKIMCEVSSSRVNMRDLPGYLLANE